MLLESFVVNDVASVAKSAKTGSSYSFNPSGDTNDFEVVKTELARIKDNKLNKEELFK